MAGTAAETGTAEAAAESLKFPPAAQITLIAMMRGGMLPCARAGAEAGLLPRCRSAQNEFPRGVRRAAEQIRLR